jgi:hypothetical protein
MSTSTEDLLAFTTDYFRYNRQDKSLSLLTKRFVSLLMNSPNGVIHLNTVSVAKVE